VSREPRRLRGKVDYGLEIEAGDGKSVGGVNVKSKALAPATTSASMTPAM